MLYQAPLKERGKDLEANFVFQNDDFDDGPVDITDLNVLDFFEDPEGR